MKTGLVLEGGGMRALFSAGVMDVLMENGFRPDGIIGVSAGACFGCNYKSLQKGRSLRYNLKFAKDPRYMGLRNLIKEGNIVSAEFAYHTLPTQLDIFDFDTYRNNPAEFYVVCSDIEKGEAVYHRIDDMTYEGLEWMRASASMPLVSVPVELDGKKLLDGGMADSIPLKAFNEMGFDKNIVILTQPKDYVKHPSKLNKVFKTFMKKYPAVGEMMADRHNMYNAQLQYIKTREHSKDTIVICPDDVLGISRTSSDTAQMRRVYEKGRTAALKQLDSIKRFVSEA